MSVEISIILSLDTIIVTVVSEYAVTDKNPDSGGTNNQSYDPGGK